MPLSCAWNDMNAAFILSYEESAEPVPAVTGADERPCGTTGTASRRATPVHDQNELSDIAFQRHERGIHDVV
jgi:hypothetical protein